MNWRPNTRSTTPSHAVLYGADDATAGEEISVLLQMAALPDFMWKTWRLLFIKTMQNLLSVWALVPK
jgi:hypothetical protein